MSTLKVTNLQNPSAATPALILDTNGTVRVENAPISLNTSGSIVISKDQYLASNLYYDAGWKFKDNGFGAIFLPANGNGDMYFFNTGENTNGPGEPANPATRLAISNRGNVAIEAGLGLDWGGGGNLTLLNSSTIGWNGPYAQFSTNLYYNGMWRCVSDGQWGAIYSQDNGWHSFLSSNAGVQGGQATLNTLMRMEPGGNILMAKSGADWNAPGFQYEGVSSLLVLTNIDNHALICRRNNSEGVVVGFYFGTAGVGSIYISGSGTTYATTSDYRLKENVVPLTGAAERVMKLKPSRFNFIAEPDKVVDGFLAHEAQDVVPEAVTGQKDGVRAATDQDQVAGQARVDIVPEYQGIDQAKLVPLLTAALQEALKRIEILEAKVVHL